MIIEINIEFGSKDKKRYYLVTLGIMMTSSNGNIFRVTGPLWGEFTGHREFPSQTPVTRDFDVFLWWAPEQTVEQTSETPVICDDIALIMTSL